VAFFIVRVDPCYKVGQGHSQDFSIGGGVGWSLKAETPAPEAIGGLGCPQLPEVKNLGDFCNFSVQVL